MSRADYAHWNEEADYVWWMEEGRHVEDEPFEDDDQLFSHRDAEDAFSEELAEMEDEDLLSLHADDAYNARWPRAKRLIVWELRDRGLEALAHEA